MSPAHVLRRLDGDRMPFALVGRWAGGGAILGSEPVRVISSVPEVSSIDAPEGFVGGGWVGYLGFGLGASFERLPPAPPRPEPLPVTRFAFYDHVLRMDASGQWWIEALNEVERLPALLERLRAPVVRRPWRLSSLRASGAGAAGHCAAVADCVERIAAGELFQANLCLRLEGRFEGSTLEAFASASEQLQPAYGAYVDGVLSFSPELFLKRVGRDVETAPIKGTAPRVDGSSATRDELVASSKDAAEHVMIVDLMRNDLGRVAEYGSVVAPLVPDVEAHPGVWHLVSRVRARLREGVDDAELLRATFPPGSVTGAPKIQALKVISALEGTAREVYTGAIGIMAPASGLELNVAIRTLEVRDGAAWLGCGGGIVADSDPVRELHEAFDKARPIAAALGSALVTQTPVVPRLRLPRLDRRPDPARGVFETMLVRNGRIVALDAHLARLRTSVHELYGFQPELSLPVTDGRLRVDVRPDGSVEYSTAPVGAPTPLHLQPIVVPGGLGAHKWADREPVAAFESPGVAALICDADGTVLEASSANVWALLDGVLVTPPTDGRILPGVTRERLLGRGAVAAFTLDDLRRAEAIVVTSSIRGAAAAGFGPPTDAALSIAADLRHVLNDHLAQR